MILLKGQDSTSGSATILAVAAPGVWDRYALGFEAALIKQFGPPIVLSKAQMAAKEAIYKA